jgi:Na+-transporting NADH:ubiquinone oxidoreductase subunit NqrA
MTLGIEQSENDVVVHAFVGHAERRKMIRIGNMEAVASNVRFVEVIRRMTKRIEAGNTESAAKLGRMAWDTAKSAGISVREWDSRFDEG